MFQPGIRLSCDRRAEFVLVCSAVVAVKEYVSFCEGESCDQVP